MGQISEDLRNKCKRQAEDLFYFFVQSDYDKVLQQKTNSTEDPSKDSNVLTQKINSREDSGKDSNVLSEKINSEEDSNVLSQKINSRENLNILSQKRNSSKDSSKDSNLLSQKINSRQHLGEDSNVLSQKINSREDSNHFKKLMKSNKRSKKNSLKNIFICCFSQKINSREDSNKDSNLLSQKMNSREDTGEDSNVLSQKISTKVKKKLVKNTKKSKKTFSRNIFRYYLSQKRNTREDSSKDSNLLSQKMNSRENTGEDSNLLSQKINSGEDSGGYSNVFSQKISTKVKKKLMKNNKKTFSRNIFRYYLSQKRNRREDSSKDSNLLSQKMNSRENTGEESNLLSQKINSGEDSGGYSNVLSQKIRTKVIKKLMKNNKKSKKTFSRNIFRCYLSQKSKDSGEDSNFLSQKINSREDSILPNTNLPKKLTRPKLTCRLICYTSPTSSPTCLSFEDLSFKGYGDYDDKEDDKDDVVVDLTYNLQNHWLSVARYRVAVEGPTQEEIKEAAIKLEWVGDEIQKKIEKSGVEKDLIRYITDSPKLDYNSFAAYLDGFIGKSKDVDDFILFLNISKRVITETQSFGTKTFKYIRRFVGSAFADNIAQKNNVVEFVSQRINN